MQTNQIELTAFGPEYLEAAVRLSRQAGWPIGGKTGRWRSP